MEIIKKESRWADDGKPWYGKRKRNERLLQCRQETMVVCTEETMVEIGEGGDGGMRTYSLVASILLAKEAARSSVKNGE